MDGGSIAASATSHLATDKHIQEGEVTLGNHRISDTEKPSQVTDRFFLYAYRQKGKYPKSIERSGKWLLFVSDDQVDEVWGSIKCAVEEGHLGDSAKVATARPNSLAKDSRTKVICVYTYDWTDEQDVGRVRRELRQLGFTQKLPYKADEDTLAGRYTQTGHRGTSKYYE